MRDRSRGLMGHLLPLTFWVFVASRDAGNQKFNCAQQFFDRAPGVGLVRLYYLPQSRRAVN